MQFQVLSLCIYVCKNILSALGVEQSIMKDVLQDMEENFTVDSLHVEKVSFS